MINVGSVGMSNGIGVNRHAVVFYLQRVAAMKPAAAPKDNYGDSDSSSQNDAAYFFDCL